MTLCRSLQFDRLLIGNRWAENAQVEVGAGGVIRRIGGDGIMRDRAAAEGLRTEPAGAERVSGWTVPGVPNLHSHAFQRAMAGLAEGSGPGSFWSWRDVMYRFAARLAPEDVEAVAAQLFVEMLKAGFTCVGEFHYLHHAPDGRPYADEAEMSRRILEAATTTGIGLVHLPVLYETGGFDGSPLGGAQLRFRLDLEALVRLRDALGPAFREAGQRLGWAVHSLRAVSPASLRRATEFLDGTDAAMDATGATMGGTDAAMGAANAVPGGPAADAPIHIHVAEQEREVEECSAARGARPVEWLLENAPVDERWCLVHATHMTRGEAGAVARRGAVAGLCPTTEANLGDGLFPLETFARSGGRFGVGTDSHVSRSPVEELRLLEYGLRLASRRRGILAASVGGAGGALLAQAWGSGARALAWNGGRVEVGARADFVILDEEHPALVGRDGPEVLDSWVFSGTDNPVRDVFVGGRRVVQDGRHRREEEVLRAFRKTSESLARRI